MASEMQNQLPGFCADQQAIVCMAHTIYLAARDGLKALGATPEELETPNENDSHRLMSPTNIINDPDGLHLNYNSIVSQISQFATYLNQSPQRHEKFITTVHLVYNDSRPTKAVTLLSHVSTRCNSAYEMLNCAWTLKDAYHNFCSTLNLQNYQLSAIKWEKVKVMIDFLHPLHEATHIICGSKYPMINHALPLYILLIKRIQQACQQYDVAQIKIAAEAMITKLTKYLCILLLKTPIICSTILNPRFKLHFFQQTRPLCNCLVYLLRSCKNNLKMNPRSILPILKMYPAQHKSTWPHQGFTMNYTNLPHQTKAP
ncbi:hypothetical protein O181_079146 [Austropuccinia psidii MF-1]|uniref:Uncharacterized protein n=1 Tax=Austropuccinia psidii MF-1 TaxID=1389203 RepID=A0A9Q3FFP5_9BASI|nr:hypothetical protein [Austropuccinia psidii MF-1]